MEKKGPEFYVFKMIEECDVAEDSDCSSQLESLVRLEELRGGGRSSSLLPIEKVSSDNPSNISIFIS